MPPRPPEADPTIVDVKGGSNLEPAPWDRFLIEGELGKGGMAVVHKGRDKETGERVALKELTGNLDQTGRARFEREVKAVGKLSHDNICRVLAVGMHNQRPFLAMELVEGETLAQLAKRGPDRMPAVIAASLMAQLLDALAHAHNHGVLHRDLKPANVMLRPDGLLKLVDFGIAKSADDETVTKTGNLVGTPAFMAPEQVRLERVDHRADLFAAGMTMFAMMRKGRHRFAARKNLDPTQMLIRVALEPTPPLLEEVPSAPVSLDNLLAGLTSLDPSMRFADAESARAVLDESGLVPRDAHALIARYFADPLTVAKELDAALARDEAAFADAVGKHEGGKMAAALALHRASLLDPGGDHAQKLARLCETNGLAVDGFDRVADDRAKELRAQIEAEPTNVVLLKRMSDVMKAKKQVRLYAVYLWRYVRERPDDELALTQLRALLDGPPGALADHAERSNARLSTKSIVAGIKTGGFKAAGRASPASKARGPVEAKLLRPETAPTPHTEQRAEPRPAESTATRAREGRATATVVVAKGADDARSPFKSVGAAVLGAVLVGAIIFVVSGVRDAGKAIRGEERAAHDVMGDLAAAERQLESDPAEAVRVASAVLAGAPRPEEGLMALWVRARANEKLGRIDEARKDCDLYIARVTDFHDPHLVEIKQLAASLGRPR